MTSVDASNCDREPIHIPGAIQPHGLLLALSLQSRTILQVSDNIEHHARVDVSGVLGRGLDAVLDGRSAGQVATWGGDPNKAAEPDATKRLHPRRSFEQWREEVRCSSSAWTALHSEDGQLHHL
jgi:light-regulated signal transduction histidine kinase (bacteriophytochrome)